MRHILRYKVKSKLENWINIHVQGRDSRIINLKYCKDNGKKCKICRSVKMDFKALKTIMYIIYIIFYDCANYIWNAYKSNYIII